VRKLSILFALIFLVSILTSCAGKTPTFPPTSDADRVATIVAATLAAIPSATSIPEPTVTLTSETPFLLPRSLYFQAGDPNGKLQVYRLGRDGITITQITSEADGVNNFDISPVDGKVTYNTGNHLMLADNNGANQKVIATNQDPSNNNYLSFPNWSPDGQTIAYVDNGSIYFYSIETGTSRLVLGNNGDNLKYDLIRDFSPDGSKLVVHANSDLGIYDIPTQTVAFLHISEYPKVAFSCSPTSWSPDSKYLYFAEWIGAAGMDCIRSPGLWRFNPDGTGVTLMPGLGDTGAYENNKTAALWQDAAGNLLYLYSGPETGFYPFGPFSLVRADTDGVSNRVVLRPETFHVTDASLWTPDGSAVVIIQNDGTGNRFGNLILVSVDPSLPVVTLLADARKLGLNPLRWGP
jgi:dipeptidyl aminopeptidase/acylaminoacyl peptidase